jgi:hypothetical protein
MTHPSTGPAKPRRERELARLMLLISTLRTELQAVKELAVTGLNRPLDELPSLLDAIIARTSLALGDSDKDEG